MFIKAKFVNGVFVPLEAVGESIEEGSEALLFVSKTPKGDPEALDKTAGAWKDEPELIERMWEIYNSRRKGIKGGEEK